MFSDIYKTYNWNDIKETIYGHQSIDIKDILNKKTFSIEDLIALLSPQADSNLEDIAQRAHDITKQRFGNTIQLYAPLYISNECSNSCLYCGFNVKNSIKRITLNDDEIKKEADALYESGFRHILVLTGEDHRAVPLDRLSSVIKELHKRFPSVSVEIYPLDENGYTQLVHSGLDGLTIYQETYNHEVYDRVHPAGRKKDFVKRLNTPDYGGMAQLRRIGIGALLGLSDWRVEGFFTAIHGLYLMKKYWKTHLTVSFPRLRSAAGEFHPDYPVDDRSLTHLICVMRIVMEDAGLILSTREPADLRDNLIPLGITMMSAGSKTNPGGYSSTTEATGQFDIEDTRSPGEIAASIKQKGFDVVWKDWDTTFLL